MAGLMVIGYFDIAGVPLFPLETDAPLIVDSDAILTLAVSFERFKPVRRRHPQVFDSLSVIKHLQFAKSLSLNLGRQPSRTLQPKNPLRLRALKRLDYYDDSRTSLPFCKAELF